MMKKIIILLIILLTIISCQTSPIFKPNPINKDIFEIEIKGPVTKKNIIYSELLCIISNNANFTAHILHFSSDRLIEKDFYMPPKSSLIFKCDMVLPNQNSYKIKQINKRFDIVYKKDENKTVTTNTKFIKYSDPLSN